MLSSAPSTWRTSDAADFGTRGKLNEWHKGVDGGREVDVTNLALKEKNRLMALSAMLDLPKDTHKSFNQSSFNPVLSIADTDMPPQRAHKKALDLPFRARQNAPPKSSVVSFSVAMSPSSASLPSRELLLDFSLALPLRLAGSSPPVLFSFFPVFFATLSLLADGLSVACSPPMS